MKKITVNDVMKTKMDVIDGMSSIAEALAKMDDVGVKCLVVNKRDQHDEFGMLLISDIARKVLAKDKSAKRINVYEVMIKPTIEVSRHMDIRYCARLFERFHLSRALVTENNQVVGIISLTDMVMKGLRKLQD